MPTLGETSRKFGIDFTQAYIETWIINIRKFINVGKPMSDEQTIDTAGLIVETYPFLNIADINLIFKKAKLGKFGVIYDRIDGQVILSWFDKHFSERCSAAAERSIRESDKYKSDHGYQTFEQITNIVDKYKKR